MGAALRRASGPRRSCRMMHMADCTPHISMSRFLVIDDDEMSRHLLVAVLTSLGGTVHAVPEDHDIPESIPEDVDIIVMDAAIASAKREHIVEHLRHKGAHNGDHNGEQTGENEEECDVIHSPGLFITTAVVDDETLRQALALGAEAVLQKPVNKTEMSLRIDAALKRRAEQMELLCLRGECESLRRRVQELEDQPRAADPALPQPSPAHRVSMGPWAPEGHELPESYARSLEQERQRYSAILASLDTGLTLIGPDMRIEWVNDHVRAMFPSRQPEGELCYRFYYGMEKPCATCGVREVFRTGEPTTFERYSPETEQWFSVYSAPVFDKGQQVTRVLEGVTDITERKHHEQRLLSALHKHEQLAFILNNSPLYAFVWKNEPGWPVEFVSDNITDLGYAPEDFLGGHIAYADILHPEDVDRVAAEIRQHSEAKRSEFKQEYRLVSRDGDMRWMEDMTWIIRDEQGEITHFHGILYDVSRRKRDETQLRKLWRSVENSPTTVVITDTRGIIEYVNPAFTTATGYSREEALGQTTGILRSSVHDDAFYAELWTTISAGQTWRGEICNKRKDGTLFWEQASISPVVDDAGSVTHYVAVKEDISDKKDFERLKQDVERIMRHDLKTPLNTLIGLPQVLTMDENLTEEQLEIVRAIEDSGKRMLHMLDISVDLLKMEMGEYEYIPGDVDILAVIRKLLGQSHHKLVVKQLEVNVQLDGAPVTPAMRLYACGEERLVYTMFSNLLDNAIEASPRQGAISISITQGQEILTAVVRNSGAVAQEVRTHFFEKFKTYGKTGGTGLGTYSARLMADAMQYDIAMETSDTTDETWLTITMPASCAGFIEG